MANEITKTISHQINNSVVNAVLTKTTVKSLVGTSPGVIPQIVGDAWEALALGDLNLPKDLSIYNSDTEKTVDVATADDDTGIFATIPALELGVSITVKAGVTYYVKASAASAEIFIMANE